MDRTLLDTLLEHWPDEEFLLADGFEDAVLGVAHRYHDPPVIAYDYDKCIGILMSRDVMTYEEAVEFFEFNTIGAYVGERTPVFVVTLQFLEEE